MAANATPLQTTKMPDITSAMAQRSLLDLIGTSIQSAGDEMQPRGRRSIQIWATNSSNADTASSIRVTETILGGKLLPAMPSSAM